MEELVERRARLLAGDAVLRPTRSDPDAANDVGAARSSGYPPGHEGGGESEEAGSEASCGAGSCG